jgi:hypothetical protein
MIRPADRLQIGEPRRSLIDRGFASRQLRRLGLEKVDSAASVEA